MENPSTPWDVAMIVPGEPGPGGPIPDFDDANWEYLGVKGGRIQLGGDVNSLNDLLANVRRLADMAAQTVSHHTMPDFRARMAKRKGLTGPVQFVLKLLQFWHLQRDEVVGLLGFGRVDAAHVAAVLDGREQFRGRDVRDRIAYLFRIRETLWMLFRDLEVENEWLREPHSLLDERSPLSLLTGGSMEDLLLVKEYVDTVAGR